MREIIFRGKRIKDNKWVFGHYNFIDAHFIYHYEEEDLRFVLSEVDPETVGQYTGLVDKNGNKIFEGDIVHVLGNQQVEDWKNVDYIGLLAFLDAGFCVIDGTIGEYSFRRYALSRFDFDLEVIGNIHDNPELLGE